MSERIPSPEISLFPRLAKVGRILRGLVFVEPLASHGDHFVNRPEFKVDPYELLKEDEVEVYQPSLFYDGNLEAMQGMLNETETGI